MNLMLRVALFLRDEISLSYDLIPSDVTILLILASHIGDKDFWYITRPDVARECRLQISQFTRRAKKLESQKLITVRRTGKANAYGITLPKIEGKQWCLDRYSSTHQPVDKKSDEYSSTYQMSTRVPNRWVPEYPHKETINKQKKTERARTKRAPLSPSWFPNDQNMITAREVSSKVGKSIDQLIAKFRNLQISKEATSADWNRNFENFLIDEKIPAMIGNGQVVQDNRPKMKDWTQERIERQKREPAEAKNGSNAQEAQPKESEPVVEHIPYKELKRRYLLKQQQGELNRGKETDTIETGDNHSRGSCSS